MKTQHDRRTFLKTTAACALMAGWPFGCSTRPSRDPAYAQPARRWQPALVRGAFFYPPAADVLAGRAEDSWSVHQWFTWPGNQFEPDQQREKFEARVRDLSAGLALRLALEEEPLYTDAAIQAFVSSLEDSPPDALLLFNFWNSFSPKLRPILDAYHGPIILYHPVGASHQLPPAYFRTADRVQYIHSIENWEALERGLRAVHAHTCMTQSRLLRVSGRLQQETTDSEPFYGMPITGVPADHYNRIYDETVITPELEQLARSVRRGARNVTDLSADAFLDAARAHAAVRRIMQQYDADGITIECLFLKHRKPCLSFALHNGQLIPCGCENDLNATLTLMLGAQAFGRGGFQHNPEFDTEQNLYFASHCTCTTRLHGPRRPEATYDLRPFFHQMPKTLALDVQWPPGERVTLAKYHSGRKLLDAWRGTALESPASPPTGGCATRVLVQIDHVADVCDIYQGPHPVLFCGDYARHLMTYAGLYGLETRSNVG